MPLDWSVNTDLNNPLRALTQTLVLLTKEAQLEHPKHHINYTLILQLFYFVTKFTKTVCIPKYNRLTQTTLHQATAINKPIGTLYWYLLIVYKSIENGIETATMAWVEGIPYSIAHLLWSLTTGGPGRSHLKMSFTPWPKRKRNRFIFFCIRTGIIFMWCVLFSFIGWFVE